MSLFDLAPKDNRRALYGRGQELESLVRLLKHRRWSVVLGPRMVGKTSLVKSAVSQLGRPYVYANLWGTRGTQGLLRALERGLNENQPLLRRAASVLRRVQGVSVGGSGITLAPQAQPLRSVAELAAAVGSAAGSAIFVLDEVQELASASGALLKVLAQLFNSYPGITFVFTGSFFGLVRSLLEPGAESPLFGRPPAKIELRPFDRATALGFLEQGFREHKLEPDRDQLGAIVDRTLDGVPGWLTLFGNSVVVEGLSLPAAEKAALQEGKRVAATELAHFLEQREASTYWRALRILSSGASWTELRDAIQLALGRPINDNSISSILRRLRDAGLVGESDQGYTIRDPMIRAYVREARRPPVVPR